MSEHSSALSAAYSTSQMQPKFKDCRADFDKAPSSFRTWIRLISGIVRNLIGGDQLEAFLDSHLKRQTHIASTRPSFLDHADFDFGPEPQAQGSPSAQASSAEVGDDASLLSDFASQGQAATSVKYSSLSEEAIRLDKSLFHVLFTIISGTYLVVISDLTGHFARYTCAITALWKHNDLSSSNRRIIAMNEMSSLVFHGDASKWKVDFISRTRELYESGATLEHYIMQCAFSSFEGKNSQVQAMITEDINKEDVVKPGMSIERLANKYASFLATLTSGKNAGKVNSVNRKWCQNCRITSHNTADCRTGPKGKKGDKCDYCGRAGHPEDKCFLKERHENEKTQAAAKDAENDAEGSTPPLPEGTSEGSSEDKPLEYDVSRRKGINSAQLSDRAIADLFSKLKSGEIKLFP